MKIYLKTRDECQTIVKSTEAFYCTETIVQGFKVEMYDYRLASYEDFKKYEAWELRGLTFIYNPLTDEWERHIVLQKFFNCNQTENYMYNDLINHKILNVQDKRDGSMITFVELPNDNIVAKSKMSFISPQAIAANELYLKDVNLQEFIKNTIKEKATVIFELTSPHNQIVLEYWDTTLHVLQIRERFGHYINIVSSNVLEDLFGVNVTQTLSDDYYNLDILLKKKEVLADIEGWVITTPHELYKIKTDWYMQMHGLVTEKIRENLLIKTVLDKNIDDVLAQIPNGEKKDFIKNVEKKVNEKFNHLVVEFKELRRKYFQDFNENKKKFAIKHSKDIMFKQVNGTLCTSFRDIEQTAEKQVKQHIEKQTLKLEKAIAWLNK